MNLLDYESFQRNDSGGLRALMMSRRRLGKTRGQMHRISLISLITVPNGVWQPFRCLHVTLRVKVSKQFFPCGFLDS